MPEYLDDPSVLTKDKLKSELLAYNVELPSGNPTKDVYVQLYLKNLTAQNKKHVTVSAVDAFSSDEELPPPVLFNRSRSSGRKATRKTDKVRPDELDVTILTDEGLRDELRKHGVDVGPILATTRKPYEKKLQKLLDDGPAQPPLPQLVLTEIQVKHNGNSESDLYSDTEEEVIAEPETDLEPEPEPEPVAEPEPVPVVERPVRSRGKTPITGRSHSSQHNTRDELMDEKEPVLSVKRRSRRLSHQMQIVTEDLRPILTDQAELPSKEFVHHKPGSHAQAEPQSSSSRPAQVEKIAAGDQTPKVDENDVLKERFPNDVNNSLSMTATCRRPIRGAAGRPVKSSDLWNDENSLFSPKNSTTTSSLSTSYTEKLTRVTSLPTSTPFTSSTSTSSFSSSRPLSAATSASQPKPVRRSLSLWIKLFLLVIVAAFLFLVYQAMETNTISPFGGSEVSSDSTV